MSLTDRAISEHKFHAELDLPRSANDRANGAGVGGVTRDSRRGASQPAYSRKRVEIPQTEVPRSPKVGVVKDVEDFGAELHIEPLEDPGVFRERKIDGLIIGSFHSVLAQVSDDAGCWQGIATRIEPVQRRLVGGLIAAGDHVGTNRAEVIGQ